MKKKQLMHNLLVLLIMLILILSEVVIAEETITVETVEEKKEKKEIDYSSSETYANPDVYSNPEFYTDPSSDPAKWDWEEAGKNWDLIVFSRSDIYAEPDFYEELKNHPDSVRKLSFNDQNFNHELMDEQTYLEGMGCEGCGFEESEFQVKFSAEGLIHPETGALTIIPGSFPWNTKFSVNKATVVAAMYENPDGSPILIDPSNMGTVRLQIPPTNAVLIEGNVLSPGEYGVDEKGIYIGYIELETMTGDHESGIDGIIPRFSISDLVHITHLLPKGEIIEESNEQSLRIYLFTDGKNNDNCNCRYISSNPSAGTLSLGSGADENQMRLDINNNHPAFAQPDQSSDNQEGISTFLFALDPGSTLTVMNRNDEDAIPLVSVIGDIGLENGDTSIINTEQGYMYEVTPIEHRDSIPFELQWTDNKGNPMLGTPEEPKKIIFDEHGNFGFINFDSDVGLSDPHQTVSPRLMSIRQDEGQAFQLMQLEGFTGARVGENRFVITGPDGTLEITSDELSDEDINEVTRQYLALPPAIQESVNHVELLRSEEIGDICGGNVGSGDSIGGCASEDGRIYINRQSGFTEETLYHEGGHQYLFGIEQEENLAIRIAENIAEDFDSTVYEKDYLEIIAEADTWDFSQSDVTREQFQYYLDHDFTDKTDGTSFTNTWTYYAGEDIYGTTLGIDPASKELKSEWPDGTNGPKNGCVEPYGCNNAYEDVSSFVEEVNYNPGMFSPLITQGSESFDQRYIDKLQLLLEYDFITEERFETIFERAGLDPEEYKIK